ncbi:DET1 homolog [Tetranychus urticae]|uniref:DET1 homolog n=1 Tax=Tetranychus urticae TaxID=32264 RepID=T1JW57_TETUR|nr:DET1 homolog [Tetranychus urticae]
MKRNQSIIHRLRNRELVDHSSRSCHRQIQRSLHEHIYPNMTVINIERPPCIVRKFTPDGKRLIGFSYDQVSIFIYEYLGPDRANDLLENVRLTDDFIEDNGENRDSLFTNIFKRFFKLKHIIKLAQNDEKLNRECSLFTFDSRYVIVASSAPIIDMPNYYDVLRNNESVSVNVKFFCEDYIIYLIDIKNGKKCDQIVLKTDNISLPHNQGLYLYDDILAILSVQHQTIYLYRLDDCKIVGKTFIEVNSIGRFCYDDDPFVSTLHNTETRPLSPSSSDSSNASASSYLDSQFDTPTHPYHEVSFCAMKHRILAFFYRQAQSQAKEKSNPELLLTFYRKFDEYCGLRMSKMQLLDRDHLLIKYEFGELVAQRLGDQTGFTSYFVFYQISKAKILDIYSNTSNELAQLFENYCDYFRNTHTLYNQAICSSTNNFYARECLHRFKNITNRDHGSEETTRRVLSLLPLSAQSYTPSPYLDLSLFKYDDRWISPLERPKVCSEYAIQFFSRSDGSFRFQIHADRQHIEASLVTLRLVAYTFHPTDPFALSIQRTSSDIAVHLHFRYIPQELWR